MRIVNKQEFLKLPSGTVYSDYKTSGNVENLNVKLSTTAETGNDFLYDSLLDQPKGYKDSGERFEIFNKAEADSNFSFEMDLNCTARDGSFDDKRLYLIYESKDVENLIKRLTPPSFESGQRIRRTDFNQIGEIPTGELGKILICEPGYMGVRWDNYGFASYYPPDFQCIEIVK